MNAYAKMGNDVAVETASPHKLISMLYEGAILAIVKAKAYMQNGEIAAKGESISKAMSIINLGLLASLDTTVGGELAQNLQMLYEYMSQTLLEANVKNDPAKLDEVAGLLRDLKSAWDTIEGKSQADAVPPAERASMSYARA
jgi:flagellar protein FliS